MGVNLLTSKRLLVHILSKYKYEWIVATLMLVRTWKSCRTMVIVWMLSELSHNCEEEVLSVNYSQMYFKSLPQNLYWLWYRFENWKGTEEYVKIIMTDLTPYNTWFHMDLAPLNSKFWVLILLHSYHWFHHKKVNIFSNMLFVPVSNWFTILID